MVPERLGPNRKEELPQHLSTLNLFPLTQLAQSSICFDGSSGKGCLVATDCVRMLDCKCYFA
eukprot:5229224-Pleurochrysis_carterae.AAC.2